MQFEILTFELYRPRLTPDYPDYSATNAYSSVGEVLNVRLNEYGLEQFRICVCIPKTRGKLTPNEKREFKQLPRCTTTGKRKATIWVLSKSFVCEDSEKVETLKHFGTAATEVISVLEEQASHFTGKSSFNFDALVKDCKNILSHEFSSMDEIRKVEELAQVKYQSFVDKPLTWSSPELDWDAPKYHKNARSILDRPIFWSTGSEFSPNGSDIGADVLSRYESARGRPGRFDRARLFHQLLMDVASPDQIRHVQDSRKDTAQFSDDRVTYGRVNQTVIAFAVAQIKFDARCLKSIFKPVLSCIRRELRDYNCEQFGTDCEQFKKDYRYLASQIRKLKRASA